MTESVSHEGPGTSSQIHPPLRQRMLNRAATFSEGAHPIPPLRRRRSSILSEYSDTRHSFRSSTDNLLRPMDPLTSSDEPSYWHSAPLAFAILPAVGGLLFQNGGAIVTDVLLLGLGSIFLNWCVRAPWEWYHAAQQIQYVEHEEPLSDTIVEENEANEAIREDHTGSGPEPAHRPPAVETSKSSVIPTTAQKDAGTALARESILALICCFVGPVLGAYLLHAIRSQLTRPAEGLVSDYNLTIFVMAAELRPVSHVIKLKRARMTRLQRIVRADASESLGKADAQELARRLTEVEERLAEPVTNSDVETVKISATVRQGLQPQLDALNRAVRRYEKRQAAQTIQTEARFGELELRLKDALSLAAAAARTGQKPGLISMAFTWAVGIVTYGMQTAWAAVTYPFRFTISIATELKSWLINERQPRKRTKGQSNGHSSIPTPRMQSRSGR
ncbi:hypothetical protein K491DRAFT_591924 [Lophiostoma macrostomum CBS 122681]|uniref:Uncharacterized protein n=1 Tax=Lophiostoma macrostomum CBS 122681 TaxID=1314788 RepID=A0A6A6TI85_9PLEO|nr:hypothetical protein K491DRAFT_591924 [Lophiostoma macrostomum CBS 122681]